MIAFSGVGRSHCHDAINTTGLREQKERTSLVQLSYSSPTFWSYVREGVSNTFLIAYIAIAAAATPATTVGVTVGSVVTGAGTSALLAAIVATKLWVTPVPLW